jgi:hypothetical protein
MAFDKQWRLRDDFSIVWRFVIGGAVVIALGLAATTAAYIIKPVWLGFERKAFIESHQYKESQQQAIRTLETELADVNAKIAEYRAADDPKYAGVIQSLESQRTAIQRRIAEEKAKLNQ